MGAVVAGLRRCTGQPVQAVYSDLASNNFNRLFANLEQARCNRLFPAGVYSSAVGGSFYDTLLPPGTVHLATCFNALHWLDQLPEVPLPDGIVYRRPHPPRPGLAVTPEAAAAFARQADQDLVRFLECRARELVEGGKLLVAGLGDTEQARVGDGPLDVLNDACLDLVAAGQLPREGYQRLTAPCYFRTVPEFLAPLERAGSPVGDAFMVDRAEAIEDPLPFLVELRRGGDVAAYAEAYTGFLRAVSEPVVRAAFDRSDGAAATVEGLYDRIRDRVLTEPERYAWRHHLVAVLLTRR
jgi:hypothetical protein